MRKSRLKFVRYNENRFCPVLKYCTYQKSLEFGVDLTSVLDREKRKNFDAVGGKRFLLRDQNFIWCGNNV